MTFTCERVRDHHTQPIPQFVHVQYRVSCHLAVGVEKLRIDQIVSGQRRHRVSGTCMHSAHSHVRVNRSEQ
jgi:hypothetical protein